MIDTLIKGVVEEVMLEATIPCLLAHRFSAPKRCSPQFRNVDDHSQNDCLSPLTAYPPNPYLTPFDSSSSPTLLPSWGLTPHVPERASDCPASLCLRESFLLPGRPFPSCSAQQNPSN